MLESEGFIPFVCLFAACDLAADTATFKVHAITKTATDTRL